MRPCRSGILKRCVSSTQGGADERTTRCAVVHHVRGRADRLRPGQGQDDPGSEQGVDADPEESAYAGPEENDHEIPEEGADGRPEEAAGPYGRVQQTGEPEKHERRGAQEVRELLPRRPRLGFINSRRSPMKRLSTVLFCMLLAVAPIAYGQDKGKAPTEAQKKQQERMSACNKRASDRGLKGDERKTFMSSCLKDAPQTTSKASPKQKAQQDKMGDCNKQANLKNMKGEDRKRFMSSCLSG